MTNAKKLAAKFRELCVQKQNQYGVDLGQPDPDGTPEYALLIAVMEDMLKDFRPESKGKAYNDGYAQGMNDGKDQAVSDIQELRGDHRKLVGLLELTLDYTILRLEKALGKDIARKSLIAGCTDPRVEGELKTAFGRPEPTFKSDPTPVDDRPDPPEAQEEIEIETEEEA